MSEEALLVLAEVSQTLSQMYDCDITTSIDETRLYITFNSEFPKTLNIGLEGFEMCAKIGADPLIKAYAQVYDNHLYNIATGS